MNRYLYDGSTDGLLSAIEWILEEKSDLEQVILSVREDTFFEEGYFIGTDITRAEALFLRLRQHVPDAAQTLYYFMLAEKEGMATALFRYISLAFKHGDKINGYLTHTAVNDIVTISKKAGRELHRMKGLLRFEKLSDGTYLAKMEPDCNIIQPLAYHFSKRLRAEHWFLYDVKRRTAACWENGFLRFGAIEQFTTPAISDDEKQIQALWQTFFKTIAIPDRTNPRLQKSNMPMKYWKYLTEKQRE
ncbi:MAG: TIGR03915 family putative DNA repair protein [Chlorobiaceae bacterium]